MGCNGRCNGCTVLLDGWMEGWYTRRFGFASWQLVVDMFAVLLLLLLRIAQGGDRGDK